MVKCDECEKDLPKNGNFVTCLGCKGNLHYSCSGISSETWKAKSEAKKKEWTCKKCRQRKQRKDSEKASEGDSDDDTDSDGEKSSTSSIQAKRKENKGRTVEKTTTKIKEIEAKLAEVIKSLEFVMKEREETVKENKLMKEEIKKLRAEVNEMKNTEQKINKTVEENKYRILKQSQYDRNKNIEICGCTQIKDENLETMAKKMADCMKIENFKLTDIEKMHRVVRPARNKEDKPNTRPDNIVIQFKNRSIRDLWLAQRQQKLKNCDISEKGNDDRIFVNEHLTPENKRLLMMAKETAKTRGWKYVWVKDGKILLRKKEGDKVIAVEKEEEITKIR